ncbi:hypothetical protein [Streptomyces sp. Cmuel-A718b]|uniref:hypothetical protein n=1 Tax=Streptomyces TaxID=1883 RepID=UPI001EFA3361|nr:hypothetical protein [Streptomyces sp. Cmuel-A718b]WST51344.1 hypothetical protein OG475_00095 [Streptomyces rubiginosohelvolus]
MEVVDGAVGVFEGFEALDVGGELGAQRVEGLGAFGGVCGCGGGVCVVGGGGCELRCGFFVVGGRLGRG